MEEKCADLAVVNASFDSKTNAPIVATQSTMGYFRSSNFGDSQMDLPFDAKITPIHVQNLFKDDPKSMKSRNFVLYDFIASETNTTIIPYLSPAKHTSILTVRLENELYSTTKGSLDDLFDVPKLSTPRASISSTKSNGQLDELDLLGSNASLKKPHASKKLVFELIVDSRAVAAPTSKAFLKALGEYIQTNE